MLQQCRFYLPWLQLTPRFMWSLALVTSLVTTLWCYGLTLVIGCPLPFFINLSGPPFILVFTVGLVWYYRKQHGRESISRSTHGILPYLSVLLCQYCMIIVYPLFITFFGQLSTTQQTPALLILPVIKFICKHWINRALRQTEDTKAEAIVLNVEVFHALFTACCMESATSKRTIVALVVIDLAHAALSLWDVREISQDISKDGKGKEQLRDLVRLAVATLPQVNPSMSHNSSRQIVPVAPSNDFEKLKNQGSMHSVSDSKIAMKTLQLLYVTEFIALVEFTEIIMPFIYVVYIVTFSRLSNHEYYQFLQGVTSAHIVEIVANVAIYASLELISLLFLALGLWINYRLSLLHQLVYVLETRFLNVQAKMLPWMLYVANNALVQFGADYSFKFEWLMETKKGD